LNILLTGVGAPGTRGTLFALKQNSDGVKLRVIGVDLNEDVIGKYWVDKFLVVPPPEDDGYVDRINEICSSEDIDVVIPQTTRETAKLSKIFEKIDAEVVVASVSAIERANNKFELLKLCSELKIPCPEFGLIRSDNELVQVAKRLGYPSNPVVVKPPVSFGSRGFRVLREGTSWNSKRFLAEKPNAIEITLDDLSKILSRDQDGYFPELLVTEYLPGDEYSVDAFIGEKAEVAIPRLRKIIVNGISFRTSLEYRNDIMENTLKAAKVLDLKYAFGFQFKLDDHDIPKVLECNPRVQGTMAASVFSGVNVIWMSVREAIHHPVDIGQKILQKSEFYRYWGGLGTSENGFGEI
jgi:carbamoyl-phosphate synthase large subunit